MRTLEIGDRSRDGLLEITDTRPVGGQLYVTVRELVGGHAYVGGVPVAAMRRLARRAVTSPAGSRLVRTWHAQGSDHATFAVWGEETL